MVGTSRVLLVTATLLALGLSGCAGFNGTLGQGGAFGNGNQAAIAGQGSMRGEDSKTLDCARDQAQIAVGIQGSGKVVIKVEDGAGDEVYSKTFDGQGQTGETVVRSGEPGEWTITARFSSSTLGLGSFEGQYGIYLR